MARFNHWFVSRQKRDLVPVQDVLESFNQFCVGKEWTKHLQLDWEDRLNQDEITVAGPHRSRRVNLGGGAIRTNFKQLKDLGLVYSDNDDICHLTIAGEEILSGKVSFVEGMTRQLQRYQYPSALTVSGTASIDKRFTIHPFQFMVRLVLDDRLQNQSFMDELAYIVIHDAESDWDSNFQAVVRKILDFRNGNTQLVDERKAEEVNESFRNIANTLINYLSVTHLIEKIPKGYQLNSSKTAEAMEFAFPPLKLIGSSNPDILYDPESYLRQYGRGTKAKDHHVFSGSRSRSKNARTEAKLEQAYNKLAAQIPITNITSTIIDTLANSTGIQPRQVERFLIDHHPNGDLDEFYTTFKDLAIQGTDKAIEFEKATQALFASIFGYRAEHIGQMGDTSTPDVFIESDKGRFCGIIDNKAYKDGFSITGDFHRKMVHEYIPNINKYVNPNYPLAFFCYIGHKFGKNIDSQIQAIYRESGIPGSAISTDLLIKMSQLYEQGKMNDDDVKDVFSLNREIRYSDLEGFEKY